MSVEEKTLLLSKFSIIFIFNIRIIEQVVLDGTWGYMVFQVANW